MPKKGLTPEQKRKVPRNLRGAGVRRHWCPFCDTWHPHPQNMCEKHPSNAAFKEKQRESAIKRGRELADSGYFDLLRVKLKEKRENDPQWRARESAARSKAMKGRKVGPSPMRGRKLSSETRAKISEAMRKTAKVYTTADLLRLHSVAPQMPSPTAFDFFRTTAPPPPERRDEFTGGRYIEDVFGSDEFDPFH